jgi:hypothetical protein
MRNGTRENLQTQRLMAQLRGCGSRVYGKPQAFAGHRNDRPTSSAERFIASGSAASYEYSTGRGVAKPAACPYPFPLQCLGRGVALTERSQSSSRYRPRYYSSFAGPRICPRISPAGAFVVWTFA